MFRVAIYPERFLTSVLEKINGPLRQRGLLKSSKFKERLVAAKHLISFGMDFYLNAPKPAKDKARCGHDWLAERRANPLALRVRNAFPSEVSGHPEYRGLVTAEKVERG